MTGFFEGLVEVNSLLGSTRRLGEGDGRCWVLISLLQMYVHDQYTRSERAISMTQALGVYYSVESFDEPSKLSMTLTIHTQKCIGR